MTRTSLNGLVKLDFPLDVRSEANARDHWRSARARARRQRSVVACEMLAVRTSVARLELPVNVTLTLFRLPHHAMDDDNLSRAFKAVRDEIARQLFVDDADQRVRFFYAQEDLPRGSKVRRVRIVIAKPEPREGGAQ